ncbi:MAG: helix-turn-helix transcriptional regulator [Proteobacteria bacterium]|nr:helix-turn-helix transcriptional regulator [Pseudomonadota bacterium]
MPIHEKIRLLRQVKGLTQEEVADKLNLSVNGYGKIERGNCDINLHRLEQIAEVFGVEVVELLGTVDRNIFNLSCTNNMDTQNNHNYSTFANSELQSEIEKQQLIIQLKDKEIELRDEKIRHLTEVVELLKAKDSL